jgi:hypothetical protein
MGMHADVPARARVTVLTRRVTAVIEGPTLGRLEIACLLKADAMRQVCVRRSAEVWDGDR